MGTHPVVVAARESAIPLVPGVVCVLVTSSFRGHVAEVAVGANEGLDHDCAVNCDNVFTLRKEVLSRRRGHLHPAKLSQFDQALAIALGLA